MASEDRVVDKFTAKDNSTGKLMVGTTLGGGQAGRKYDRGQS